MQTTSALWKRLWAAGARLEAVAVIDGVTCEAITAPVIHRALTQDGLSVGNAVSATCAFTVRAARSIPRAAEVAVRMRLTDGETCSEWLEAGTFFVSHRSRDAVTGLTALECYDAMLKGNAEFPREGLWPRSMAQVVGEIAEALGVEQDGRNDIQTGDDFQVLLPEAGATMREVLGGIGSAHGGNWIITPQNKLRLVPLGASGEDEAAVLAVLGGVSAGPAQSVTGLRATGIGEERLIGSAEGLVVEISSPFATEGSLEWLSRRLIGAVYQPYTLRSAIYDPAAELGDAVASKEDVASALYAEAATLGPAFRGDISAPEPGELADEYPYPGVTDRLKRLREEVETLAETKADEADVAAAEARANAVTAALEQSLTQRELFDRLTNNGETQGIYLRDGKLYINGTYIDAGTLNANLLRAGIIADDSGKNYWILDGVNSEFVTRKGVIGDFLLENGSLLYGSLAVGGRGAYVGRDGVTYNETMNSGNTSKVHTFAQGLEFHWNGDLKTILFLHTAGIVLRCYDAQGVYDHPLQFYNESSKECYLRYALRCTQGAYFTGDTYFTGKGTFLGDMEVRGTKNRRVATADYGERLLYSYETPSPMFGDVGEGVIGADGRCYVWLDPVLAQAVSTEGYQVFLQAYGEGGCHVAKRAAAYFLVEGAPGLGFGWELKARQRDFDQRRLERASDGVARAATDYGEQALQYINRLREGRISA